MLGSKKAPGIFQCQGLSSILSGRRLNTPSLSLIHILLHQLATLAQTKSHDRADVISGGNHRGTDIGPVSYTHLIAGLMQNIQELKDHEQELIESRELAEQAELKQSCLLYTSQYL